MRLGMKRVVVSWKRDSFGDFYREFQLPKSNLGAFAYISRLHFRLLTRYYKQGFNDSVLPMSIILSGGSAVSWEGTGYELNTEFFRIIRIPIKYHQ
ncbi:hypothetical protein CEXT_665751 [Caerostris extrusa]|uniref:Uncharacterized protein n=1 Tax=Caerostris extrusa TaxID=172846 RepID=A0AAV4TAZ4_CAEEX|nr:hypothetical protein CEXT_665751 [Caerostris extrusa]